MSKKSQHFYSFKINLPDSSSKQEGRILAYFCSTMSCVQHGSLPGNPVGSRTLLTDQSYTTKQLQKNIIKSPD
ncbi:hypothetical protein [Anditalea andensis]|uniref:hypothetical protein n=1 Tax=Anditalea andensis TaxID=1048983 RepID=UPI0013E04379|nr:hypothetical protein [Anditalea andensis]